MALTDEYKVGEYFLDSANHTWTVRLQDAEDGSDTWFDCNNQCEAEILSRLVRIEVMMKRCGFRGMNIHAGAKQRVYTNTCEMCAGTFETVDKLRRTCDGCLGI